MTYQAPLVARRTGQRVGQVGESAAVVGRVRQGAVGEAEAAGRCVVTVAAEGIGEGHAEHTHSDAVIHKNHRLEE